MRTVEIFVRDKNGLLVSGGSVEFFLNGTPAGNIPVSEGRARIERVGPTDSVEVVATFHGETQRAKLGPNQHNFTFKFEVDMTPPQPKVHPDLIDAFIILLLAAAIAIFVFAMATQFISSPVFQKLPSFVTDTYTAVWSSVVAGAAGIGGALLKALTRTPGAQTPNYLFYVVFTAIGLIVLIVGLAFLALALPK